MTKYDFESRTDEELIDDLKDAHVRLLSADYNTGCDEMIQFIMIKEELQSKKRGYKIADLVNICNGEV